MTTRIRRLDSLTIDKIAAGEVVDIPASCVKELVDNALDAGASEILIEIQLGGRELIRVTDNGCGMSKEDVLTSIERHATSKLRHVDDFDHITSLGFRGEALAAIVAVSHMKIRSAEGDVHTSLFPATVLVAKGGDIESVTESQSVPGTCVEVTSLFYNVPARRKFLKSPAKDTQEIVKAVTKIALAVPHVSFCLVADGKQMLVVPKDEQLEDRIRTLFGDPFRADGLQVEKSLDGLHVRGLIVSPSHTRSTRSGQHVVVNGRHVYSLPISYAVRSGYGTTCENGRQPMFALHLEVDPASVDVNIHPQKREIRLSDEERIKKFIQNAVREALFGQIGEVEQFPPLPHSTPCISTEQEYKPYFREEKTTHQEELSFPSSAGAKRSLTIVGDLAIFHEGTDRKLLVLNLRQAMRSVVASDVVSDIVVKEPLLLPIPFDCSPDEAYLLNSNLEQFEQLGFTIRPFGPQNFLIEATPSNIIDIDAQKLILEMLHEGIFALKRSQEEFCKKYATLYVSSMKGIASPVSTDVAHTIYQQWTKRGAPKIAPDGSVCAGYLTEEILQELILKSLSLKGVEK